MRNVLVRELRRSLWDYSPRDHWQGDAAFRRRQLVSVGVVVVGAIVLALSLRLSPGSSAFIPATLGLAAVWTVGAFASGPIHLGRIGTAEVNPRPLIAPIVIGVILVLVFVAGAFVIREITPLADLVRNVLDHANQGSIWLLLLTTIVNGIAEELFFRGALYAAIRAHQVPITTVAYTVATAATGNFMLAFAAVLLGIVVGLQRRASGGILAPVLTHLTWSVSMLFLLPLILGTSA